MQTYKRHIFLTGLVALIFLLAGCGIPGVASSPPTPAQTLQNSAKAMSQLKSVHFDLSQASVVMQSSNSTSGMTLNVTGQGDTAGADQVSANFALAQKPLLALVSVGQTVYVQVSGGTWYSANKSHLKDATQNFFSQSPALRLGQFMALLQNSKLTDHGQESLNGVSLDHITVTPDQQTLQTLSSQLNGLAPTRDQSSQNQITQATLDLWIDQSTGYVHQLKLDVMAQANLGSLQQYIGQNAGGSTTTLPVEVKAQLNFSKFNQPVTIQAPANSVPFPQ